MGPEGTEASYLQEVDGTSPGDAWAGMEEGANSGVWDTGSEADLDMAGGLQPQRKPESTL